jgi:hypothetical protein
VTVTIDTTSVDTPLLSSSERSLDRTPNNNLVGVVPSSATDLEFWFSLDRATFTEHVGARLALAGDAVTAFDLFADASGYLHFVYVRQFLTTYDLYYRRGTLNAAQTQVTWSTATTVATTTGSTYGSPTVAAHAEGTGWKPHIAWTFSSGTTSLLYARLNVTSGGVVTNDTGTVTLKSDAIVAGGTPAIDFAHTGDGVTPQASPHVYVSWVGESGGVAAVCHMKLAYSAGSWTAPGTVRVLASGAPTIGSGFFDGTRSVYAVSNGGTTLTVYERDSGDTTTTTRTPTALASDGNLTILSAAYDTSSQDIYLYAAGATAHDLKWVKYDRAGGTWGAWTAVTGGGDCRSAHAHRNTRGHYVEVQFVNGAAPPYDVKYDPTVALNQAPTAPTWVNADNAAADVNATLTLDWVFTDPDTPYGDTPSAYALKRDIGGTVRWWGGASFNQVAETWTTSTDTSLALASSWGADVDATHRYAVAQKDAAGAGGSPAVYSSWLNVVPDAKVNPVVTGPAEGATVTTATTTVTWTSTDQSAFLVEILDSAGTTTLWSSGWIVDSAVRSYPAAYIMANATTYRAAVTTKTAEGLASDRDTDTFTTAFTVPVAPVVTVTEGSHSITIEWDNPASGEAVTYNDLFVRLTPGSLSDGNRTTTQRRIGTLLDPDSSYEDAAVGSTVSYDYFVRAWAANGTYTDSDWVVSAISGGDADEDIVDAIYGGSA